MSTKASPKPPVEKMVTVTVIREKGHTHRGIKLLKGAQFEVAERKTPWLVQNGVIADPKK